MRRELLQIDMSSGSFDYATVGLAEVEALVVDLQSGEPFLPKRSV